MEISGLRFCDVDRLNAKSVKLIDDKIMKVNRVILGKLGLKLDIHHQCQVSHHNHILTRISFARSHLTIASEG